MTDPAMDLFAAVEAALEPHYRLERELGRGGMGVVYQATDRTLDRRVAIKVAHPELTENAAVAQRFLAEARMLARIQHPNIVAIHLAGRVRNLHYYVMDEVPGESLRQLLNRDGPLPVARARAIAADIAAALDAAGRAGFVHRDVKPENVLLDGATGRALLADFGIARASDGILAGSTTGQGIAIGTPAYMSPEQAAGEQVDPRSDLYGLGVVAYEMLAGQPPFVGPNRVVVSRHLSEHPVPLDRIRPDVPRPLSAAVMRALEKAPSDRWQTGDEMRRALQGERVERRATRRRMGTVAAAAMVAAGLAGWIGLAGRGGPPAGVDPRHSMLLLPFENLQQDRTLGWLSDGSVSMLGLNLAQWTDLTVVEHDRLHDLLARHGLAPGDAIGLEMARRMARDAGVWTVVRGEFSWAGDTLRLVARVYDVATGQRVDVVRVDASPGEDVRPMFDELAARLLDLSGAPAEAVGPGLAASMTHSVEAFRRYLAGMELLNNWNLPAAAAEFQRATAIDSTFALAYYRLSHVMSWIGMGEDSAARAALARASRHAQHLPEHHRIAISAYQAFQSQDLVTARALYQRLLARDRGDREAWNGLAESWFHDTLANRSLTYTRAYRAFRRALAIDPAYAVPYLHVTDLLRIASGARPPIELLAGDSVHDREAGLPRSLRSPGRADMIARARAQWVADARAWVVAHPAAKLAHVSLLDAHVQSGEHEAALAEINRFRGVAGDRYPELPFEQASVLFAAGRTEQAAAELGRALDTATVAHFTRPEARPAVVRAIASAANIYAYRGDLEGARRVITLATDVGARLDSVLGLNRNLPPDLVRRRMLGELYAAFGGPVPALRQLWTTAAEAARQAGDERRPIIAASGAAAAVGLLTAPGGDTLVVAELRRLLGSDIPPEVLAFVALTRHDSAGARHHVAKVGERFPLIKDDRLLYTVFSRPIAAQVHYALGDYAGALRIAEGFQPGELDVRQFDMRWALLPRMRLLGGLAHERLGRLEAAASEYESVLVQWARADPLLYPVLGQAERGLLRLGRTTERLEAMGYQLTTTRQHRKDGCPGEGK